jgi:2-polyprenyl-3-methyl-5-hydroxy-6-metoxy-1,4-benzoquinol methylase
MDLPQDKVKAYFSRDGTVSQWWDPEGERDRYHFHTEKRILQAGLRISPDWRILDVGCGQGRYTTWFAQKGCRVTGVDISQEMLDLCRRRAEEAGVSGRVDLVLSDADDLPQLGNERFDVVSCMGTFVHLPDLARAATSMVSRLEPGGRFLFTFASAESLHGRLVSAYFSNPCFRKLVSRERTFNQIARPLRLDHTIKVLESAGLTDFKLFGIGLLFLFVRPELRDKPAVRFLRGLSIVEERMKPYYTNRGLARLSATVLGIGTRVEAGEGDRT